MKELNLDQTELMRKLILNNVIKLNEDSNLNNVRRKMFDELSELKKDINFIRYFTDLEETSKIYERTLEAIEKLQQNIENLTELNKCYLIPKAFAEELTRQNQIIIYKFDNYWWFKSKKIDTIDMSSSSIRIRRILLEAV